MPSYTMKTIYDNLTLPRAVAFATRAYMYNDSSLNFSALLLKNMCSNHFPALSIPKDLPVVEPAVCASVYLGVGTDNTCDNTTLEGECWAYCVPGFSGISTAEGVSHLGGALPLNQF